MKALFKINREGLRTFCKELIVSFILPVYNWKRKQQVI